MISATRKIGRNKGKPRLWIEGKILNDAGLPHGTPWYLRPHEHGLDIVRADLVDGESEGLKRRKIAGKADRPVIDIAAASLDPMRTSGEMPATVALHLEPGLGFIAVRRNEGRN